MSLPKPEPKRIGSYLRPARKGDLLDHHTREMLLGEARAQRAAIELMFNTAEHWNRMNPNGEPIDPDPDGMLRQSADDIDALLLNNTMEI